MTEAMSDPSVVVKVRSVLPVQQELFIAIDDTWTVKDLKNHVSGNFPGQPDVLSQRLVCAGYLLEDDNRLLKDYLRPEVGNHHVVHLICKGRMMEPPQVNVHPESEPSPASLGQQGGDGNVSSDSRPGPSATTEADHLYLSMLCYQQFLFYYYMAQMYGASWLHHYSNAAGITAATSSNAQSQSSTANQRSDAGNEQPAAQPVINAQGQNEEDEQPRDWLDFLYIVSRTILLFSVLYMYSTVGRFALVMCCGFFFYAFEVGWFGRWEGGGRERQMANEPEHHQQARPRSDDADQGATLDQPGPSVGNASAAEPMVNAASQPISPIGERPLNGATPSAAVPQQQPSAWTVFWSTCRIFVSSFFVSLLPQRHVALRQLD